MIYCVGRNYADHAKELGNDIPSEPLIFFKPPASIVMSGETIYLPKSSNQVQFECELAIKLNKDLIPGDITIANDLTARDLQKKAQENGKPWSLAKGFKQSCGLGSWMRTESRFGKELENLKIRMLHNDRVAQEDFTKNMIFPPSKVIDFLKQTFPIVAQDIVLTGTPAGVSNVQPGDSVCAELFYIDPDSGESELLVTARWNFAGARQI